MEKHKKIYILILAMHFFNFSYSQDVNIYDWQWALPKEKTNCRLTFDFSDMFFSFDQEMKSKIDNQEVRYQPNEFDYFFRKEDQVTIDDEFSILVFCLCETEIFGARAFIYDHTSNKVVKEFKLTTEELEIKNIPLGLVDSIHSFITTDMIGNPNERINLSSQRFSECMQGFEINYLYKKHIVYQEEIDGDPFYGKKNLDGILEGIDHYFDTENYEFLEEIRKVLLSKKPVKNRGKLRFYEKKHPRLFTLIKALILFENYRDHSTDAQLQIESYVEETINNLLYNEASISDREERILNKLSVDYDEISERLGKGLLYVTNCNKIFNTNYSNLEKELNVYLQVLSNTDISPILKSGSSDNCSNLKIEAARRCKKIISKQQEKYMIKVKIADSLFDSGQFEDAVVELNKLDNELGNVSFFLKQKIESYKREMDEGENKTSLLTQLASDLSFNSGDEPSLVLENINVIAEDSGNISVRIEKDSNLVNSWLSEVNYLTGSYISRNQEEIESKISRALINAYKENGHLIQRINFEYLGSSDRAGFKGKGKLGIKDHEYRSLVSTEVCENAIYNYSDTEYRNAGRLIKLHNQCLDYNKLISGKYKRREQVKDSEGNLTTIRFKQKSDYSKNLALAYLRARKRHDTILRIIGDSIPSNIIDQDIKAEVAPFTGYEYRFVNLKISIELK